MHRENTDGVRRPTRSVTGGAGAPHQCSREPSYDGPLCSSDFTLAVTHPEVSELVVLSCRIGFDLIILEAVATRRSPKHRTWRPVHFGCRLKVSARIRSYIPFVRFIIQRSSVYIVVDDRSWILVSLLYFKGIVMLPF